MDKANSTIGEQLRAARTSANLSLYAVAKETGISAQRIGQIEKGQNTTVETINRIASIYGKHLQLI